MNTNNVSERVRCVHLTFRTSLTCHKGSIRIVEKQTAGTNQGPQSIYNEQTQLEKYIFII
jgi:hypothetical protein